MKLINKLSFSQVDQIKFAKLSGDWNPIHVDPIFARRTVYGQVVHGIHIFLKAMNAFLSNEDNPSPSEINVTFLNPLNLGQNISVEVVQAQEDIILEIKSLEKIITFIRMKTNDDSKNLNKISNQLINVSDKQKIPKKRNFLELQNVDCEIQLSNDIKCFENCFNAFVERFGVSRISAILGLSKFVGMEYPGLNSLFTGFSLIFSDVTSNSLKFQTIRFSIPNAPVKFSFNGSGILGTLDAFLRPSPHKQTDVKTIIKSISNNEFKDQKALIIGGSRGLGELTAKIIASGGGKVLITYASGQKDADNVCKEINEFSNGFCEAKKLDFYGRYEEYLTELVTQLYPTHIYYFSSPRIRENKEMKLDFSLLNEYMNFYVYIFEKLCCSISTLKDIKVFYPSTEYIKDNNNNFKEYILAKTSGEKICDFLNAKYNSPRFIFKRLPRVKTDQTITFLQDSGIEATDLLINIIKKL